jgi:hypothetical protein
VSTPGQICGKGQLFSEMLDDQGNAFAPATTDGSVTVSGDAPPPPAGGTAAATLPAGSTPAPQTPGAPAAAVSPTLRPAASPTPVNTVLAASARPDIKNTILLVAPATQNVERATEFKVEIKQQVTVDTKGAEAELKFKQNLLQIVKVEPGPSWTKATGASSQALADAISQANSDGVFKTSFLYTGSDTVKAGESTVMTVTMKGKDGKDGKSAIDLLNVALTGADGSALQATTQNGEVIVGSGEGGGSSLLWPILGGVAVVAVVGAGGGGYIIRRRRTWA